MIMYFNLLYRLKADGGHLVPQQLREKALWWVIGWAVLRIKIAREFGEMFMVIKNVYMYTESDLIIHAGNCTQCAIV